MSHTYRCQRNGVERFLLVEKSKMAPCFSFMLKWFGFINHVRNSITQFHSSFISNAHSDMRTHTHICEGVGKTKDRRKKMNLSSIWCEWSEDISIFFFCSHHHSTLKTDGIVACHNIKWHQHKARTKQQKEKNKEKSMDEFHH